MVKTIRRACILAALAGALTSCGAARGGTVEAGPCVPFSVSLGDDLIETTLGSSRVSFFITLAGCSNDLEGISEEERLQLIEELEKSTTWTAKRLAERFREEDLRAEVAERINRVLGREAVTDVLLHSLRVNEVEGGEEGPD